MRRSLSVLFVLVSVSGVAVATNACHTDCHDDGCEPAHAEDTLSVDIGTDASTVQEAEALCQCLLVACHDAFHDKYGEGDDVAIPACQSEARGIPDASRTCRKAAACDADPIDCASGLGDSGSLCE